MITELSLTLGMTSGRAQENFHEEWRLWGEPRSATCKTNNLTVVLSPWPLKIFIFVKGNQDGGLPKVPVGTLEPGGRDVPITVPCGQPHSGLLRWNVEPLAH